MGHRAPALASGMPSSLQVGSSLPAARACNHSCAVIALAADEYVDNSSWRGAACSVWQPALGARCLHLLSRQRHSNAWAPCRSACPVAVFNGTFGVFSKLRSTRAEHPLIFNYWLAEGVALSGLFLLIVPPRVCGPLMLIAAWRRSR